jgi:hypothetical protein
MKAIPTFTLLVYAMAFASCNTQNVKTIASNEAVSSPWTNERIWDWYDNHPWLVGCNFIPSTAINQLEMWQEETFDIPTIERELDWADGIGFNVLRVYLHDLLWEHDSTGFVNRIDQFLDICDERQIKVMFVFFDNCWYGNAQLGKQPDPTPGLHNSFWLQSPRYEEVLNTESYPRLEKYVKGVLRVFSNDNRILAWDLYNEPGNNHTCVETFPLVRNVFKWAREVAPMQPVTVCIWKRTLECTELNQFVLENSDFITFHNYSKYEDIKKDIENLQSFGKPLICTEYLARGFQSLFETHLPLMKEKKVGAINWGLVFGKTQTVFPWDSPLNGHAPEVWHHDIFWPDGKPYKQSEVELIKKLTSEL